MSRSSDMRFPRLLPLWSSSFPLAQAILPNNPLRSFSALVHPSQRRTPVSVRRRFSETMLAALWLEPYNRQRNTRRTARIFAVFRNPCPLSQCAVLRHPPSRKPAGLSCTHSAYFQVRFRRCTKFRNLPRFPTWNRSFSLAPFRRKTTLPSGRGSARSAQAPRDNPPPRLSERNNLPFPAQGL